MITRMSGMIHISSAYRSVRGINCGNLEFPMIYSCKYVWATCTSAEKTSSLKRVCVTTCLFEVSIDPISF